MHASKPSQRTGSITRKVFRTSVVMGYETTGVDHDFGEESPYTRLADTEKLALGLESAVEVQRCLNEGRLMSHPVREIGGWEGISQGLEILRPGKVTGQKLVIRIPQDY